MPPVGPPSLPAEPPGQKTPAGQMPPSGAPLALREREGQKKPGAQAPLTRPSPQPVRQYEPEGQGSGTPPLRWHTKRSGQDEALGLAPLESERGGVGEGVTALDAVQVTDTGEGVTVKVGGIDGVNDAVIVAVGGGAP